MEPALDRLASCAALTTEHAAAAAASLDGMRALMAWATKVARPGQGGPKVLMALARLARTDWLEGTPTIEIAGDASATSISIFTEHGLGIRERVLPATRILVPFEEFARAVRLGPQLVSPFKWSLRGATLSLTLDNPADAPNTEREPIQIDPSSLHEQERETSPPPPGQDPVESPPFQSGIHTHPTVRRMVAVVPEALRSGNDDD